MFPRVLRNSGRPLILRALDGGLAQSDNLQKCCPSHIQSCRGHSYITKRIWPEPLTQQTLDQFLDDINYFENPRVYNNIGLDKSKLPKSEIIESKDEVKLEKKPDNVDEVLNLLGEESAIPELDLDDSIIDGDALARLAVSSGIYRDLFHEFNPDREFINFTKEQGVMLSKYVPDNWLTDLPHSRVRRKQPPPTTLSYFEPVIGVSARFLYSPHDAEDKTGLQYAHRAYYGNIIPACEAASKPSITLDGKILSGLNLDAAIKESHFDNWNPGHVSTINFGTHNDSYYSVALINLDHLQPNASILHWMVSNIRPGSNEPHEEICEYLPAHGIKGFGYSRYVFLVFQHQSALNLSKIENFSLESRIFDVPDFISKHKESSLLPVGLSWFQTSWDQSSNAIFHDYLKQKSPVYEYIQQDYVIRDAKMYPGIVPFNIYLDYIRSKKSINQQVLLERLKDVNPFDYKDQYVPPRVPATVFVEENIPDWMRNVMFKKKNKVGYWRGLRPASALLPLDNNADLDYPLRPIVSSRKITPGDPNEHPWVKRKKRFKDMPCGLPLDEHQPVRIEDDHEIHLDEVRRMMGEFEVKPKKSTKDKN